jgi:hypothetical protein
VALRPARAGMTPPAGSSSTSSEIGAVFAGIETPCWRNPEDGRAQAILVTSTEPRTRNELRPQLQKQFRRVCDKEAPPTESLGPPVRKQGPSTISQARVTEDWPAPRASWKARTPVHILRDIAVPRDPLCRLPRWGSCSAQDGRRTPGCADGSASRWARTCTPRQP